MFRIGRRGLSSTRAWAGLDARVTSVLGAQWGDEGKGKLVDILAGTYDIVARFNGGSNAGHTLVVDGVKYAFHLLPCGMLYPDKTNVIGNGVVLHVPTLEKELAQLTNNGITYEDKLLISNRAHLLFDFHQTVDGMQETNLKSDSIGTTKRGIGPCYSSKATRNGVRVGELLGDWNKFETRYFSLLKAYESHYSFEHDATEELTRFKEYRERLSPMVADTMWYLNDALRNGKTMIAEGANAALLDIDFGTYPYVTSSPTTAGGISTGLGIAPSLIDSTVGVVKAYTTRVGGGPFPTELHDEIGTHIGDAGHEYGTTTGRRRRCGWLDIPVVKFGAWLNGYSSINLTKLDVLSDLDEIKIGVGYNGMKMGSMPDTLEGLASVEVEYESLPGWKCDISSARTFEELPPNAQAYVNRIEVLMGMPVSWIGVGPGRKDMAVKGFKI